MQNRYVGDIGDYLKFMLLRALPPCHSVGVAWWLYEDSGPEGDGRHISYLDDCETWRHLDPDLFDALKGFVHSKCRSIASLEQANLLKDATWFSEQIPVGNNPYETKDARRDWLQRCQSHLKNCSLIFVDPDNGLEPASFMEGAKKSGKSVSLDALTKLQQPGRTQVVYHHQTRMAGGHVAEIEFWANRLLRYGFHRVDVVRASPWSPRAYFFLDADDATWSSAVALAGRCNGIFQCFPNGRPAAAIGGA